VPPTTNTAQQIPLSEKERTALTLRIITAIEQAEGARKPRIDKVLENRKFLSYTQTRPAEDKPWPKASDVTLPVIQWTILRYAAQILSTLTGMHPIFNVEGQRRIDDPFSDRVEQFLEGLITQTFDLEMELDPVVMASLRDGTAGAHISWRRTEEEVTRLGMGFDAATQTLQYHEKPEKEVIYDGPEVTFFPIERFGVYPSTAKDPQQAVGVYMTDFRTGDDLLRLRDSGYIDKAALDKVRDYAGGGSDSQNERADVAKAQRDIGATEQYTDDFHSSTLRLYLCYWRVALKKDQPARDWWFWIHPASQVMLHSEPNGNWSRQRPLVIIRPFPDGEGIYGDSFVDMLHDIVMGMNASIQQAIDDAAITISTPILMESVAIVEGEKYESYPGATWKVHDVNKVKPLFQPSGVPTALQLESFLLNIVERLTSVSEQTQGVQGGPQTATQSQNLEQNSMMMFGLVIQRMRDSLKKIADQLLWLCYQYQGNESVQALWDRLVGDGENPFVVGEEAMRGKYFFSASGTNTNSSASLRRAVIREVYANLMQNPLIMANPMLMFAVTKRYLIELGFRVPEELIGKESEVQAALATQGAATQALAAGEAGGQTPTPGETAGAPPGAMPPGGMNGSPSAAPAGAGT
jgi:hypothetical protein